MHPPSATATPTGAGYDLVLLAHVACVLIGLGAVVISGVQAQRLRGLASGASIPASLATYFAAGVNWPGRFLYGVPVLGVALIAMSRDAYGVGDRWIMIGLTLWVVATLVAEGALWPAERRLQSVVAAAADTPDDGRRPWTAERAVAARRDAVVVVGTSTAVVVILVVAVVVMVAQPG